MLALAILSIAAFIGLGRWQWGRGVEKAVLWDAFASQSIENAVPARSSDLARLPRFAAVALSGRYEPERQFLLDNRTHEGRAGYEVLTPFVLDDGTRLLVNRGWVPFSGFRDRLPDVQFESSGTLEVRGRLDALPSAGLALGRAQPASGGAWPKVTSFPQMGELSSALGHELAPQVLLLDAQAQWGFVREWQPPGMEPARHYSYAIQWWSFALAVGVLFVVLNVRKIES